MNKDFSTLEKLICQMGDAFYQPVEFPSYVDKLEKEFAELMAEFDHPAFASLIAYLKTKRNSSLGNEVTGIASRVIDESADVLVFLLRINNFMGVTGTELLHHAMLKMVTRAGDGEYNKS